MFLNIFGNFLYLDLDTINQVPHHLNFYCFKNEATNPVVLFIFNNDLCKFFLSIKLLNSKTLNTIPTFLFLEMYSQHCEWGTAAHDAHNSGKAYCNNSLKCKQRYIIYIMHCILYIYIWWLWRRGCSLGKNENRRFGEKDEKWKEKMRN